MSRKLSIPLTELPTRSDSNPDLPLSLLRSKPLTISGSSHLSLEDLRHSVYTNRVDQRTLNGGTRLPNSAPNSSSCDALKRTLSPPEDSSGVDDDRSPNSSVTMDTATPSSTPELAFTGNSDPSNGMFSSSGDDSLESTPPCYSFGDDPSPVPSNPRELPWSRRFMSPTETSIRSSGSTLTEAKLDQATGSAILSEYSVEDLLVATPPLTPVDEDSDEEEIMSLRSAIAASLTILRSKSLCIKGILKTALNTPSNTQKTGFSPSASLAEDDVSLFEAPTTPVMPSEPVEISSIAEPSNLPEKKAVRWNLSEEQELKEQIKLQLMLSPGKIHRSNRIIFDPSEDELMSVCSNDYPTPPLSPNEYFSLHAPTPTRDTRIDLPSLASGPSLADLISSATSNTPFTSNTLPEVNSSDEIGAVSRTSSTSNLFARKPSLLLKPTLEVENTRVVPHVPTATHTPPPTLLARSSSSSSLPLLRRAKSQSVGNSLWTNTRANESIPTEEEALEVKPAPIAAMALNRSLSDARSSLQARGVTKKRSRMQRTQGDEEEEEEEAKLAKRPKTKLAKQE